MMEAVILRRLLWPLFAAVLGAASVPAVGAVNAKIQSGSLAGYSYIAGKPATSIGDYNLPPGTNAQRPACTATLAGRERWNTGTATQEICTGSAWIAVVASAGAGTVTPANGYFVMSAGTWGGNLGGLAGANSKCLTDLANNEWRGKDDAVSRGLLVPTKTKAFLCHGNFCEMPAANTSYVFARSGAPAVGGAAFETDFNGAGPNNATPWVGFNYFNSTDGYWTYRDQKISETDSKWGYGDSWLLQYYIPNCNGWTSDDPGISGHTGVPHRWDGGRWKGARPTCDSQRRLICLVNP